jgi:hypothetical protein
VALLWHESTHLDKGLSSTGEIDSNPGKC